MTTESLLTETPGSELHATWEALAAAGMRRADLKKIRNNPKLAEEITALLAGRKQRTKHTYSSGYKPLGISEQVKALQMFPAFAKLNAAWVLNEAEAWYDSLTLPDWIENPLVYVWPEALGGYHITQDLVLRAVAEKRKFHDYCQGRLTPQSLRQHQATREAELKLKADQPGDFLIVPSQAGVRWGGSSVDKVRKSYDMDEFGLDGIAEGCRLISHPNHLVQSNNLSVDCPGAEFDDPGAYGRFDRTLILRFNSGRVGLDTSHVNHGSWSCGSSSGWLPQ